MHRQMLARAFTLSALGMLVVGCGSEDPFPLVEELNALKGLRGIASVVPADPTNALLSDPVRRPLAEALGEQFFNDDQWGPCQTSCATCHQKPSYADPGQAFSRGCGTTARNSPTLLNIRHSRYFFWDGRADSAWSQATGPLQHPDEIGATPEGVKARMVAQYSDPYQAIFGVLPAEHSPETVVANFGKAVQAHLWTNQFVAMDSPFDRELREFVELAQQVVDTNDEALTKQLESRDSFLAFKTFVRKGQCIVCHRNWVMADDSFHNIGLRQLQHHPVFDLGASQGYQQLLENPYLGSSAYSDSPATGGTKSSNFFTETFKPEHALGAFKTPTLRNVEQTGPYMHDGSLATLEDVVEFYDRGGDPVGMYPGQKTETITPLDLDDDEKRALVELLKSMTSAPAEP